MDGAVAAKEHAARGRGGTIGDNADENEVDCLCGYHPDNCFGAELNDVYE